jgi:hypothetical protein
MRRWRAQIIICWPDSGVTWYLDSEQCIHRVIILYIMCRKGSWLSCFSLCHKPGCVLYAFQVGMKSFSSLGLWGYIRTCNHCTRTGRGACGLPILVFFPHTPTRRRWQLWLAGATSWPLLLFVSVELGGVDMVLLIHCHLWSPFSL